MYIYIYIYIYIYTNIVFYTCQYRISILFVNTTRWSLAKLKVFLKLLVEHSSPTLTDLFLILYYTAANEL